MPNLFLLVYDNQSFNNCWFYTFFCIHLRTWNFLFHSVFKCVCLEFFFLVIQWSFFLSSKFDLFFTIIRSDSIDLFGAHLLKFVQFFLAVGSTLSLLFFACVCVCVVDIFLLKKFFLICLHTWCVIKNQSNNKNHHHHLQQQQQQLKKQLKNQSIDHQ